jgi:NAD(P)H-nitrite reductase large subunit
MADMTLRQANAVVKAALKKAEEMGVKMNIAVVDAGAMICACLKVGSRAIETAITAGACSIEAVGTATGAGTNCGSCRPELARMIQALAPEEAAHAA